MLEHVALIIVLVAVAIAIVPLILIPYAQWAGERQVRKLLRDGKINGPNSFWTTERKGPDGKWRRLEDHINKFG